MSKSLEELQREYEENTARLEQEKRKLQRLETENPIWTAVPASSAATG